MTFPLIRLFASRLVGPAATAMLIAGCAHEPTAIERTMASPSAQGGGKQAGSLPAIAATSSFDDADQAATIQHFNHAMESAPTGQPVAWTNPSGVAVQLSATRTFQQADGTYCREFTQTITSGSQPNVARGTACRQSDGTWQIIS
jgi:surface antigen